MAGLAHRSPLRRSHPVGRAVAVERSLVTYFSRPIWLVPWRSQLEPLALRGRRALRVPPVATAALEERPRSGRILQLTAVAAVAAGQSQPLLAAVEAVVALAALEPLDQLQLVRAAIPV